MYLFSRLGYDLEWDVLDLRFWSFIFAIVIYGVLGSPTPDDPGWVEIILSGFLIFAFFIPAYEMVTSKAHNMHAQIIQILLLYGGVVGLALGVVNGYALQLILRDVIAFTFLFLPFFAAHFFERHPQVFKIFLGVAVFCGLAFALRSVGDLAAFIFDTELLYLAIAPTVLFAGLFVLGQGASRFIREFNIRSALIFLLAVFLSVIVMAAMAADLQRASLGYAAFYILALGAMGLKFYPYRTMIVGGVSLLLALPFLIEVYDVFGALIEKTQLYGLNQRWNEFAAVWQSLEGLEIFFGQGWGATFESPAVAEIRVSFTHNLFSAALLKLGLIGMGLMIFYIYAVFRIGLTLCLQNPVLGLAAMGPFLISAFLYASYKSLDFGLILTVITGAIILQKSQPYSTKDEQQ